MDLKYIHNYNTETEATMRLYAEIGGLFGVDGLEFANEMQYLSDVGYTKINIRINSPGGSVLDGQTIISQMRLLNSGDKTEVNTYVDYMAASIAGLIAMYGKKRYIVSNGLFMMHNASGGDGSIKSNEVLDKITKTLAEQLSEASGKDLNDVLNLMNLETWMDSDEAIKNGFFNAKFDSIIKVDKTNKNIHALYEISNKLLTKKEIKMEKIVNLLKLSNEANEEVIFEAVEGLQKTNNELVQKNAEVEQTLIDLENEFDILKAELAKRDEEKIESFVNSLIDEGKITNEGKENALKSAKADFESFRNFANSIVVSKSRSFMNVIGGTKSTVEGREDWTFRDWEKKDAKGLRNLLETNKVEYDNLFNSYYKK